MRQITVGVPVFNAMPYLPEAMDSLLRQDYSDFDILAINDGSTDDSSEYLRSVRDPRLRIVNQENRGVIATRNRMLEEVSTPWLALLDGDDIAYPRRLAVAADYVERYPESGMFYSLAEYYPAGSVGLFRTTKREPGELRALVQSGHLLAVCNSTAIHNVDRTKAVGGYRFNVKVEDCDLWWRVALKYDVRLIPEVLVGYRQNHQSFSSVNLEEQALNVLYVQYLLISHLHKRKPLEYEEIRDGLLKLFDRKKIKFRNHLRAFNIELGRGNKTHAFTEFARAILASPTNFTRRLLDEIFPDRGITLGEPPTLFKKYEHLLWSDCNGSYGSLPDLSSPSENQES